VEIPHENAADRTWEPHSFLPWCDAGEDLLKQVMKQMTVTVHELLYSTFDY